MSRISPISGLGWVGAQLAYPTVLRFLIDRRETEVAVGSIGPAPLWAIDCRLGLIRDKSLAGGTVRTKGDLRYWRAVKHTTIRRPQSTLTHFSRKLLLAGTPPREVAETLGVSIPTLYRKIPAAASLLPNPEWVA